MNYIEDYKNFIENKVFFLYKKLNVLAKMQIELEFSDFMIDQFFDESNNMLWYINNKNKKDQNGTSTVLVDATEEFVRKLLLDDGCPNFKKIYNAWANFRIYTENQTDVDISVFLVRYNKPSMPEFQRFFKLCILYSLLIRISYKLSGDTTYEKEPLYDLFEQYNTEEYLKEIIEKGVTPANTIIGYNPQTGSHHISFDSDNKNDINSHIKYITEESNYLFTFYKELQCSENELSMIQN